MFAIGVNYRDHAAETGLAVPDVPATFTKFPSCLTGDGALVALPSGNVDWEVELVVVVGTQAHRVPAADGWRCVAGLTVGQDLSERVVQFAAGSQFCLGKSYPGFAPTGPALVTPDELADPDDSLRGCRRLTRRRHPCSPLVGGRLTAGRHRTSSPGRRCTQT